jgi:predicted O-linked N-acetylglucosamine transferase (SPINDLY family)
VTHLAWRLFERHDRDAFEVHAYSYGRDDRSLHRRRVMEGADHFIDVRGESNRAIARAIEAAGIDILVDLAGLGVGSRLGILAHRPAPVQVHYLGYPGTTGATFVDYFLADPVVAPSSLEPEFRERFVRLPDTFMISDETIADAPAAGRAQHGLPDGRFVFVNFNQNSRIDGEIWRVWMEILAAVPESVLWLKHANEIASANLRAAAAAHGIAAERLVFARDLADKADHVARLRLADLGLDTFGHYNGHTSTADALWAGVPVVTTASDCFPGRVAASLLEAGGMRDWVVSDARAYKDFAIGYALDAQRRSKIRAALACARDTAPFFHPERVVRSLERAYVAMVERARRGQAPAAIEL